MKATGEVMAIETSFEAALMKAVRGAEISRTNLFTPHLSGKTDEEIRALLHVCDHERLFAVYEAVRRGISADEIFDITKIDRWFLMKLSHIADIQAELSKGNLSDELYLKAKKCGYTNADIEKISGCKIANKRYAVYKMVDTCAAEFSAETPYFYSTYDSENEAADFIEEQKSGKKTKKLLEQLLQPAKTCVIIKIRKMQEGISCKSSPPCSRRSMTILPMPSAPRVTRPLSVRSGRPWG